jgi:hypothetical protein
MSSGPEQGDHFAIGCQSGILAAGLSADTEVLQMRWTNTDWIALIDEILFSFANLGTAFAAGGCFFDLTRAISFSVAGTGGTAQTLTAPNAKVDSSQVNATKFAEIRMATTAALGAGTKTLDAHPLSSIAVGVPNVAGTPGLQNARLWPRSGHPIVLRANEGLVVRNDVPATGTWYCAFMIKWREVLASEHAATG